MTRFEEILERWRGTRYHRDLPVRGVGAGCAGFVLAVLDELFGVTDPMPFESEWDFRSDDMSAARAAVRRYGCRVLRGDDVLPCDVIAARPARGELHLYLVGPRRGTLWHSTGRDGVSMTGIGEVTRSGSFVAGIYRPTLELER